MRSLSNSSLVLRDIGWLSNSPMRLSMSTRLSTTGAGTLLPEPTLGTGIDEPPGTYGATAGLLTDGTLTEGRAEPGFSKRCLKL